MKVFSVYDREKPLEQVIKRDEFLGVLFVNVHYYKPEETHEVHSHEDHEEIFVCFQGRGKVLTDYGEKEISRGDVLVFKPRERHGFESCEVDPMAYVCIGIRIP